MSELSNRSWWRRFTPLAIFHRNRLLRERIALAKHQQEQETFLHDPIEDDPSIQPVLAKADALAKAEVPDFGMGWCHAVWAAKQRILRERFNTDWFSPAEMNPRTKFD